MKSIAKRKAELSLLYVGSVVCSVLPVVLAVAFNAKSYFSTPQRTVAMAGGGLLAVALITVQTLGKLPKNLHRVAKYGIACVCLWALKPIIEELCLLLTCAFGGEFAAWAIFTAPIKNTKNNISAQTSANIMLSLQNGTNADLGGRV